MSEDPRELLRARGLRVTPQRRAILGAFRDRPDEHLSADEVHARASTVVPELGRGTVYAALAELTELELIGAVGSADPVRYEINVAPHDHFRCRLCLRLFDVDLGLQAPGPMPDGFLIERIASTAEGVCADCRAYGQGLGDGAGAMAERRQMDEALVSSLACVRYDSPLGELLLAASPRGVVRIAFADHADRDVLASRARSRRGEREARRRADELATGLELYFGGSVDASEAVVDWGGAEEATSGTLEATRRIPYGESRSYERLGVDTLAYACGYSCGANPLPVLLPCHRVSRGTTRLEAYVGGVERLRVLHHFETETLSQRV